jgi:hypothetical protein
LFYFHFAVINRIPQCKEDARQKDDEEGEERKPSGQMSENHYAFTFLAFLSIVALVMLFNFPAVFTIKKKVLIPSLASTF